MVGAGYLFGRQDLGVLNHPSVVRPVLSGNKKSVYVRDLRLLQFKQSVECVRTPGRYSFPRAPRTGRAEDLAAP